MIFERLRRNKGMTQKEFVDKLGIGLSKYNRIKELKQHPTIDIIEKAATIFGVTQEVILNGLKDSDSVNEPLVAYQKPIVKEKIQIVVELDGSTDTLNRWVKRLTSINGMI